MNVRLGALGRRSVVLLAVAAAGAGLATAQQVPLNGTAIPKFVEPLPVFTPAVRADGTKPLRVTMEEFQQKVLPLSVYAPLLPPYQAGTYVWGYKIEEIDADGTTTLRTLGPHYPAVTVVAQRNVPTSMTFVSELRSTSFLANYPPGAVPVWAVDASLNWADPLREGKQTKPYFGPIPVCVHLHGGEVPSAFDGGPDAWFTADDDSPDPDSTSDGRPDYTGPGYVTDTYTYPNGQEAGTLWFHDHGLGVTRLNPFAGLAAFYFLRDAAKEPANLPSGNQEIEIAIQDRLFDTNGQLIFPSAGINPQHPFWLPEYFGDTMVVNGKAWPFLDVQPRRYRFRLLNGSNARFYNLSFLDRAKSVRLPFHVIGNETGYLDAPAPTTYLLIAPGERYDIVVDFASSANAVLTLDNNAKAPYPNGTAADPRTTGQIMQFRVVTPLAGPDASCNPAVAGSCVLRPTNPIVRLNPVAANVPTRRLTLNEELGPGGPLGMRINNTDLGILDGPNPNKDERPRVGATEIWEVINLTADTHPLHTHLFAFQVINRQRIDLKKYDKAYTASFPGGFNPSDGLTYVPGVFMPGFGPPAPYGNCLPGTICGGNPDYTPYLKGSPVLPLPTESGWKDTVQMHPGEVTRIAVRVAPTDSPLDAAAPGTNLFPFDPTAPIGDCADLVEPEADDECRYPGGPGYVWHCHIIDHEDNEMMKRFDVTP